METEIRIDLEAALKSGGPVVLELGCGAKKTQGRIGVDCVDLPGVDVVTDLEAGLAFMPDNSVDEIHSEHVFEHLQNFEQMMRGVVRVPHFTNPYAYSDYTHKRFFGLYTFYYFVDEAHQLRRKVPSFYTDVRIRILSQKLVFRHPGKIRGPFRKLYGRWVNRSSAAQERYESSPWKRVPCHAIEVVFTPEA